MAMPPALSPLRLLLAVLLLTPGAAVFAQQPAFVAPSRYTVEGSSEQGQGPTPSHVLYVTNRSTVPIVVFGVAITACENVRKMCLGQRTNIPVYPGAKREVGRVEAANDKRAFTYRWTFSYRADSSNAAAMAVLRENGLDVNLVPIRDNRVTTVYRRVIDTTSPPDVEKPLSREKITDEERGARPGTIAYEPRDSTPAPTFRFKVAYGSILGSTMIPFAPIQLTGPCVDPAQVATYEKDKTITKTPWRPAMMPVNFGFMPLPMDLKDSALKSKDLLVRFVADTTGEAIPTSVSVLESPHGLLSLAACKTAISAKATTPARDQAGKAIRSWVVVPVRVGR